MRVPASLVGLVPFVLAVMTACTSSSSVPTPSGVGASSSATPVPQSSISFATIAGTPTNLTTGSQSLTLPTIPGVSGLGGANGDSITVTSSGTVSNAIIMVASSSGAGTTGGPPAGLQSIGRSTLSIGGVNVTPLYYVGYADFNSAPSTITFSKLNLGIPNVPTGASVGLAHYDPSLPQNGFNLHCAFGPGQVTVNGTNATFVPGGTGATLTAYFGAPIWFAVYTYPSTVTAAPTSPPSVTPTTPTASAPSSLTGTYVGSTKQTSGNQYLIFSLTQSGSSVSGTFGVVPSGNNNGDFGSLSGSVSNGTLSLTAAQQFGGNCGSGTISATAVGSLIAGTFTPTGGGCSGSGGSFSANLQAGTLASPSGTYTGTYTDSVGGTGTMTISFSQPGTVFSGTGTEGAGSKGGAGGSSEFVGFAASATTVEFYLVSNTGNCSPFGTATLSGSTLTGSYSNSGDNSGGCTATGTFTTSH
jgi:hypothetical protein